MKRIYAIPGLGTTKELFRYLKIEGAEIIVLDWPEIKAGETLEGYAKKFAEKIDVSKPFSLLGVSFGGMLCIEIGELLKPEQIFLVSSCKSRKELPLVTRFFRYFPLYKIVRDKSFRKLNGYARYVIGFEKAFLPEFIQMMESMKPGYYKHAISCIINWKRKTCSGKIIHIHGNADRLLPIYMVKPDHVINGGTHAMIVHRAEEIASIIQKHLFD